jgi:hypothetical protein
LGVIFLYQEAFWTQPRIEAFLGAVRHEQMLCLDLACENRPQWSRTQGFYGKPWLWCNIQNYGCTVSLGGSLEGINTNLPAARADRLGAGLVGLGFVNEGLDYNPVVYDLMFEMAWREKPVDLEAWIADYSACRYGQSNPNAEQAWNLLLNTVYDGPHHTRSVIDHVPTLTHHPVAVTDDQVPAFPVADLGSLLDPLLHSFLNCLGQHLLSPLAEDLRHHVLARPLWNCQRCCGTLGHGGVLLGNGLVLHYHSPKVRRPFQPPVHNS